MMFAENSVSFVRYLFAHVETNEAVTEIYYIEKLPGEEIITKIGRNYCSKLLWACTVSSGTFNEARILFSGDIKL